MKYWKDLPTWAKGTIAILGIVIVGGVGFGIYQGVKRAIEKGKESKEGREAKDELQDAAKEVINPTISQAEAQAKVSSLLTAAAECDPYGSGAQQILQVIKSLKNKADYYLVSSTFGTKTWDNGVFCGGKITGSITALISDELDGGQMAEARTHLSTIGVSI